jgi:pimeloyl-ACP methyl ester carboxylesterase
VSDRVTLRGVKVFLLHGMGRSTASLLLLRHRLSRAGFEPHSFGYAVAREPLGSIVARFVTEVASSVREGEAYGIVGHSLGNVIARAASPALARGLARIVMLAPPNSSPVLARRLARVPFFGFFTGDAGRSLGDPGFYAALPVPAVPTLVIAGNAGPRAAWLPFRGEPSDGVVSVAETRLEGAEHREVPCLHTFIMHDGEVARLTSDFLAARP